MKVLCNSSLGFQTLNTSFGFVRCFVLALFVTMVSFGSRFMETLNILFDIFCFIQWKSLEAFGHIGLCGLSLKQKRLIFTPVLYLCYPAICYPIAHREIFLKFFSHLKQVICDVELISHCLNSDVLFPFGIVSG